jgi:UDP-N-acetylglucosamine acyltransferase
MAEPSFFPSKFEAGIHPGAIVSSNAKIGKGVSIGPNAMIGPHVTLADGVIVGAGAIVDGKTSVGERTKIFPYATVGSLPQDLKYRGEDSELVIGTDNLIREYVNISLGTEGGGGLTRIGNHNLFMVYTHIAHDCIVGDHCIFANSVQIAGHVEVGDGVVFGGMSGAHQFSRFGSMAMIAAASVVVQDVPPFCMVQGDRAGINGLNLVGLRRKGISSEEMSQVKQMYRLVYQDNLTLSDAMAKIEEGIPDSIYRKLFLEFLSKSQRGICR